MSNLEKFRIPYGLLKQISYLEEKKSQQNKITFLTGGGNYITARKIILKSGNICYDFTLNENDQD